MLKYLLRISITLLVLSQGVLYAFDDVKTHPKLTETAIKNSYINTYLIKSNGFANGLDEEMSGADIREDNRKLSVMKWLQQGSSDEDVNVCRRANHFHKPINTMDWSQSQMNDSWLADQVCGTINRFSDVTWATGYTSPGNGYIEERYTTYNTNTVLYNVRQDMGWDDARKYYYDALTSADKTIREEKFVKTFRALGHSLHLLQDMAVPAHVRNDMQSHLNLTKWFTKWFNNPPKFDSFAPLNKR